MFFADLFLAFSYTWTCLLFWRHQPRPLSVSTNLVLDLVCMFVCTTIIDISVSLYVRVCLLLGSTQIVACLLIFQRFQSVRQILVVDRRTASRRHILRRILVYLRENVHSMRAVFSHNHSLAYGLVAFVFVTGPMNACLAVALFSGRLSHFMLVPFAALVSGQLAGIIGEITDIGNLVVFT